MIHTLTPADDATPQWQREMSEAFTRLPDLYEFLHLDRTGLPASIMATASFPFRVPRSFAARMEKCNPEDPLLKQVLPSPREFDVHPDFVYDPVGDLASRTAAGVLQKYHGRALIITTGACAINCRYCFRRAFPYADNHLGRGVETQALEHIRDDPTVTEVILSGGDPLVLSDQRLASLVEGLAAIPHLRRLRLHSRLPIVLPSRMTRALVGILGRSRLQSILVVHANHANELNEDVARALAPLRAAGVTLFNQSVLLKGVNDSVESLTCLSERLFGAGIIPYYLHLLDKTAGTTHFDVADDTALRLHEAMRRRLPGYLVPRLVREEAGAPYKRPVGDGTPLTYAL